MRELKLKDGERELLRELVGGTRDGKHVGGCKVVITDRRIMLLVPKPDTFSKLLGRFVGRVASDMAEKLELVHEIPRARFESVEKDGDMLVFRNDQSGYANVSFAVFDASPFETWQQRMRDWVAGDHDAVARSG